MELEKDQDGYYKVELSTLNVEMEGKITLPGPEDEIEFARELSKINVYGECEVIKNTKRKDIKSVNPEKVSHHIKGVYLERTDEIGFNGEPVYKVVGKVKPCEPKAKVFEDLIKERTLGFDGRMVIRGTENSIQIVIYVTWDLSPK